MTAETLAYLASFLLSGIGAVVLVYFVIGK